MLAELSNLVLRVFHLPTHLGTRMAAPYVLVLEDLMSKQLERSNNECAVCSFVQVDVSGNCSSEYKIVRVQEEETEIIKTKNLSQCTNRSHNITKLNPVMYNVNSVRRFEIHESVKNS